MQSCPTCKNDLGAGVTHCPVDGTPVPGASGANPWIGKILSDRYRIVAKLGEGGMGTVFLAEHVVLGKQIAVKVLREDFSRDEELVRRFQQEAISASQIGHENIVNITDFGRSPEGALFFVMEMLQGASLGRIIQRDGPLPAPRALPILVQICRALSAAHSRGIVHRDLKPDNVMVMRKEDGTDFVKVLDFGISKVSQQGTKATERLTRVGMLMGTPEYMAPEQVDATAVDHRVDIYAMGALAYEVITGTVPFTAQSPVKLLMKHQTEPPQPPSQRRPDLDIPVRLENAILRALSKQPDDRPQSMTELANELALCARELGVTRMTNTLPGLPVPIPLTTPSGTHPIPAAARGGTMQLSADELRGEVTRPASPNPIAAARVPDPNETAPMRPSTAIVDARELAAAGATDAPVPTAFQPTPKVTPAASVAPPAYEATSPAIPSALAARPPTPTATTSPRAPTPSFDAQEQPPAQAASNDAAPLASDDKRAVRRGPGALIAVLALLFIVVGGGVVWFASRPSPTEAISPPPTPTPSIPAAATNPESAAPAIAVSPEPVAPAPESPVAPAVHKVLVRSVPSGAHVFGADDAKLGVTPLELELKDGDRAEYRFTLTGYRPARREIASSDGSVEVKLEKAKAAKPTSGRSEDNPYRKIDDLKENPF